MSKLVRNILPLVIILLVHYACIEEYIPPSVTIKSHNYLTVDGILFRGDSLKTITLSRSLDAWSPDSAYAKVNDATVSIVDDLSNTIVFHLSEAGVYQSDFNPEFDRSYQLFILDEQGNEFISDQVSMVPSPEIDSIYWSLKNDLLSGDEPQPGIEIMVATHNDAVQPSYFKWEYAEAWEVPSYYRGFYKYVDGEFVFSTEIPYSCWEDNISSDIILGSTDKYFMNQITDEVIQQIPFTMNKLYYRYSIEVRQYAVDKNAFDFWKQLENSNETSGSLFDPQPAELKGNIINVHDPEDPVMGYFDIYDDKKQRIFIDRTELPVHARIASEFGYCEMDTARNLLHLLDLIRKGYNIVDISWRGQYPETIIVALAECTDCRLSANPQMPDFWKKK